MKKKKKKRNGKKNFSKREREKKNRKKKKDRFEGHRLLRKKERISLWFCCVSPPKKINIHEQQNKRKND